MFDAGSCRLSRRMQLDDRCGKLRSVELARIDRRLTAPNITAQRNPKCIHNYSEEKTGIYGRIAVKKSIVEEAKQCQKAPVSQSTQRLDNRPVE